MGVKHCLSGVLLLLVSAPAALADPPEQLTPVAEPTAVKENLKPHKFYGLEKRDFMGANPPTSSPQELSTEFSRPHSGKPTGTCDRNGSHCCNSSGG